MSISLWDSLYTLLLLRALDCAQTRVQSVCGQCVWEVYYGERRVFICITPVTEKHRKFFSVVSRGNMLCKRTV